jgi:hypothetical protein
MWYLNGIPGSDPHEDRGAHGLSPASAVSSRAECHRPGLYDLSPWPVRLHHDSPAALLTRALSARGAGHDARKPRVVTNVRNHTAGSADRSTGRAWLC